MNQWANGTGVQIYNILVSADDEIIESIIWESPHPAVKITFEFETSGFRNFIYGVSWTSDEFKGKYESLFPLRNGWGRSPAWPYWKYFAGDYRNPGEHVELLFSQKGAFENELTRAFREVQNLIRTLPKEE